MFSQRFSANIYLPKVNNKTIEKGQGRHSDVFIFNFEHILHLFLSFLLLTLNRQLFSGLLTRIPPKDWPFFSVCQLPIGILKSDCFENFTVFFSKILECKSVAQKLLNPLSASPKKCSNTLKQSVGKLPIGNWNWRLKA